MLALQLAQELRAAGIRVEISFGDKALKSAMKSADKSGARFAVILGEAELSSQEVELKQMSDGTVTSVKIGQLLNELRKVLAL